MMRKDRRKEIAKSVGVEMNFVCAIRLKKKNNNKDIHVLLFFSPTNFTLKVLVKRKKSLTVMKQDIWSQRI